MIHPDACGNHLHASYICVTELSIAIINHIINMVLTKNNTVLKINEQASSRLSSDPFGE